MACLTVGLHLFVHNGRVCYLLKTVCYFAAHGPQEFCCEADPQHQPVYICVMFYSVSFADPSRVTGCLVLSVRINAEFLIPMKCFNVSRLAEHWGEYPLSNAIRGHDKEYWPGDAQKNKENRVVLRNENRRRFRMDMVASRSSHCGCRQYKPLYCFCCSSYEERNQTKTGWYL